MYAHHDKTLLSPTFEIQWKYLENLRKHKSASTKKSFLALLDKKQPKSPTDEASVIHITIPLRLSLITVFQMTERSVRAWIRELQSLEVNI